MIRLIQILSIAALFSGCSNTPVERSYDNPEIRKLQKDSVQRIAKRPIAGQTLDEFFKDKTALIHTMNEKMPSGRAAPISNDGYFLTALHVVDEGEFFLSEDVVLKPFPKGPTIMTAEQFKSYLRTDRHQGRLVWSDKDADIAIVKFDYQSSNFFTELTNRSEKRAAVFSAALTGNLQIKNSLEDAVGNGWFKTAGEITMVAQIDTGILPYVLYESTLVVRKGMSGSPVADSSGRLIGIVTSFRKYFQWGIWERAKTRFVMIDPNTCSKIISDDRSKAK